MTEEKDDSSIFKHLAGNDAAASEQNRPAPTPMQNRLSPHSEEKEKQKDRLAFIEDFERN